MKHQRVLAAGGGGLVVGLGLVVESSGILLPAGPVKQVQELLESGPGSSWEWVAEAAILLLGDKEKVGIGIWE